MPWFQQSCDDVATEAEFLLRGKRERLLNLLSRLVVYVDAGLGFVGRHQVGVVQTMHAALLVLVLGVLQVEFAGGVRRGMVVQRALLLLCVGLVLVFLCAAWIDWHFE